MKGGDESIFIEKNTKLPFLSIYPFSVFPENLFLYLTYPGSLNT